MKIARSGISRTVIVFRDFVIKVPKLKYGWYYFLLGLTSNIEEYKTWKIKQHDLLCPVRYMSWGGWFLVMERATVCEDNEKLDYQPFINAGLGGDNKPDNYGYYNGRLVKIDYPNFTSKSIDK